jgi:hypothetical protein
LIRNRWIQVKGRAWGRLQVKTPTKDVDRVRIRIRPEARIRVRAMVTDETRMNSPRRIMVKDKGRTRIQAKGLGKGMGWIRVVAKIKVWIMARGRAMESLTK